MSHSTDRGAHWPEAKPTPGCRTSATISVADLRHPLEVVVIRGGSWVEIAPGAGDNPARAGRQLGPRQNSRWVCPGSGCLLMREDCPAGRGIFEGDPIPLPVCRVTEGHVPNRRPAWGPAGAIPKERAEPAGAIPKGKAEPAGSGSHAARRLPALVRNGGNCPGGIRTPESADGAACRCRCEQPPAGC